MVENDLPPLEFVRPDDMEECLRLNACARMLLYARGLNLDSQSGLELAIESLHRAGGCGDVGEIMAVMHDILRERGPQFIVTDRDGGSLTVVPPIDRKSMVARETKCLSLLGWLGECARGAGASFVMWMNSWKRGKA